MKFTRDGKEHIAIKNLNDDTVIGVFEEVGGQFRP